VQKLPNGLPYNSPQEWHRGSQELIFLVLYHVFGWKGCGGPQKQNKEITNPNPIFGIFLFEKQKFGQVQPGKGKRKEKILIQ